MQVFICCRRWTITAVEFQGDTLLIFRQSANMGFWSSCYLIFVGAWFHSLCLSLHKYIQSFCSADPVDMDMLKRDTPG